MKKILGMAMGVALFSVAAYAAGPDEYNNQTVGLRVVKPADWQFSTAQQNFENLKRTQLQDKDFQEAMFKYAAAPLVVMYKYPEPYPDLNPSFKVNIKPLGGFKGADSKQIISTMLPQLQKAFKDFAILDPVSDVTISGLKGAYARFGYSLEVPGVGSFPTSSELWVVPRGDYFFILGAGTRKDEKTGSRAEVKKILDSVVIEP